MSEPLICLVLCLTRLSSCGPCTPFCSVNIAMGLNLLEEGKGRDEGGFVPILLLAMLQHVSSHFVLSHPIHRLRVGDWHVMAVQGNLAMDDRLFERLRSGAGSLHCVFHLSGDVKTPARNLPELFVPGLSTKIVVVFLVGDENQSTSAMRVAGVMLERRSQL